MEARYGNLFIGASNEQLRECYESYKRVQVNKRNNHELFDDMISGYIDIIESKDESKKDIAAFSVAREHMFNEIARRYFKVVDGFSELCPKNGNEI